MQCFKTHLASVVAAVSRKQNRNMELLDLLVAAAACLKKFLMGKLAREPNRAQENRG
jgi:hypothetical protein